MRLRRGELSTMKYCVCWYDADDSNHFQILSDSEVTKHCATFHTATDGSVTEFSTDKCNNETADKFSDQWLVRFKLYLLFKLMKC